MRLLAALSLAGAVASAQDIAVIDVVDDAGRPVRGAEAYVIEAANDLPATRGWVGADGGRIVIEAGDLGRFVDGELSGSASAVVRAPGFAWAMTALDVDEPMQVTLPKGREVRFVLEGAPRDLTPFVFTSGQSVAAWIANVQSHETRAVDPSTAFSAAVVESIGDGAYRMRVPAELTEYWILVDHAGVLRAFQSGPHAPMDEALQIDLPDPVALTVNVAPEEGAPADYEACSSEIMVSPTIPDGGWSFRMASAFVDAKDMTWRLDDLAPGQYGVDAVTGTKETRRDTTRDDYFQARGWVDLTATAEGAVDLALKTYDESAVHARIEEAPGAVMQIVDASGAAPEGVAYKVSLRVRGFDQMIVLAEGELGADGLVRIDHVPGYDVGGVTVEIDGAWAGGLKPGEEHITFRLAPKPGDTALDFEMRDIVTGETVRVSDYRGQVVLLEFWASWCGPCQAPMSHNNDLMASKSEAWKGKAAVLGVSIDEKIETIQQHVGKRGWTDVRQVWVEGAWSSNGAELYAVRAVPSAFLIDQKGVVVWAGHPGELDVEARVAELLDD